MDPSLAPIAPIKASRPAVIFMVRERLEKIYVIFDNLEYPTQPTMFSSPVPFDATSMLQIPIKYKA